MLLESTFRILAQRPVAVIPFLVALWVTYRVFGSCRDALRRWAVRGALLLGVPLFVALFLAEFAANPLFDRGADLLIRAESAVLGLAVRLLDALLAAWLRVALLGIDATAAAFGETAADAVPALSGLAFPVAVFALEFAAGALLIYVLHRSTRPDGSWWRPWFTGVGAVLFCSGWLATLVRADAWRVGEATVAGGFVAGMVGLSLGVTTMILAVRPNFEGDSLGAHLRGTDLRAALWGTGSEAPDPEQGADRGVGSRAKR
ncbi:hypothetical protein [Saliphagus sp. LR7]|uniref:hypothetical protein n=1 Tax=Saliphagus sp. LR7 TaxID=2282654 RepID=UPI000DF7360A|nr:hypothetical protein [Saliphagus sp. LR7]